jgi:hypothetical protein
MSIVLESKTAKVVATKTQCIALKADRSQCVRNAGDGSQFCWQHGKSESKCGTILAPAPEKPKSSRGRPKGSVNKKDAIKKDAPIITTTVIGSEPIVETSVTNTESIICTTVIADYTSISNIENSHLPEPTPPNTFLNIELLKNINWDINETAVSDHTKIGVGPFSILVNLGAEDHINISKEIKLPAGELTVSDIHTEIIKFFKTPVTEDDLDALVDICNNVANEELEQIYTDMRETLIDETPTYEDLQLDMNKLQSIVIRDSKYVAIMVQCEN